MKRAALLSFLLVLAAVTAGHGSLPRTGIPGTEIPAELLADERTRLQGTWVSTSLAVRGGTVPWEGIVLWIDGDQGHFPAYGCCGHYSESRAFSVRMGRIHLKGYSPMPYSWSGNSLVLRVNLDEMLKDKELKALGPNPFGLSHGTMTFQRMSDK
jgi:hypothetical protein